MVRPYRLLLLIGIPALVGFASTVGPGRAQTTLPTRFVFADTTLLRDTLDLRFDGLFELSDSLGVPPDTLRALSIRYLLPLQRLVFLADSMRMPVDSVGPVLERERYNPLAAQIAHETAFGYGSGYTVGRQNSSWSNSLEYRLVRGPLFTRNVTSVLLTQTRQVGGTAEYRSRTSTTEVGWRLSPNYSVGARVNLRRTDNSAPRAITRSIQNDEYQFSVRTRQEPFPGLSSSFDFFGGPYDEPNSLPARRGFGGQIGGEIAYLRGDWLTHDLSLQLEQRTGRAQQPSRPWLETDDYSRSVQGSLNLFPNRALGMRIGYRLNDQLNERPTTVGSGVEITDRLSREESFGNGIDVDLRWRGSQDRQLTVSGTLSSSKSFIEMTEKDRFRYEPATSITRALSANGRYALRGWNLDVRLNVGRPVAEGPAQGVVTRADGDTTVDYRERDRSWSRSVTASLSKTLTSRLVLKANGTVSLGSLRYSVVDTSYRTVIQDGFVTPTAPREDYRQSYKVETSYTRPTGFSTGLELEVARALNLYLSGDRSAQSSEDRTYRAVWRWTHRLMRGLTVIQRNQMTATYRNLPLTTTVDDLSLSYLTLTTLSAVVTPRLSIDLTHSRNLKPRGEYLGEEGGQPSLRLSEESSDYSLSGRISYRPLNALTLTLTPFYQSILSEGTVSGVAVPRNRSTSLNLGGGANLNVPIGARARLSGGLTRQFRSSRTTRYRSGIPEPSPRAEFDYWSGDLHLSWDL